MSRSRRLVPAALALVVAATASNPAAADDDDLYRPPARPLDARVDPSRITRLDPPPLPEQVLLPLPSAHRIAGPDEHVPIDAAHREAALAAIARGLAWLAAQQDADGGWLVGAEAAPTDHPELPSPVAVAVTALVVKAHAQSGLDGDARARVDRALAFIERARRPDGAYEGGALSNYVTAIVLSALATIDDPSLAPRIGATARWLQESQWDQGEGLAPDQDWFGGAGYGRNGRPDLSNTQMMLDALYDAGLSPDEPAFQRALAFLTRTQNLKGSNPAPWAGDDGGFVYTPANGGESMSSEHLGEGRHGEKLPEGAPRSLRSYGSMSYAGFKSLLHAGLSPHDVRVRAVFDWIRRHWTLEENPGMGRQGLYYYYHTLARALRVAQQHDIVDAAGVAHDWREELIDALGARQRADGAWVNDADRWMEGEPVLVTAYAVLALQESLKPVARID